MESSVAFSTAIFVAKCPPPPYYLLAYASMSAICMRKEDITKVFPLNILPSGSKDTSKGFRRLPRPYRYLDDYSTRTEMFG